jgi:hypothetical protein
MDPQSRKVPARLSLLALALLTLVACGSPASPSTTPDAEADTCAPWGCDQQARFAAAENLIAAQPGHIGLVVRDRVTGAVWRAGDPDLRIWAGSTPKLALAVALKEDEAAGRLTLDANANRQIDAMLSVSDNNAADSLWDRYSEPASMMDRWRTAYGMADATYVDGFVDRWGFVQCTAQDLANLTSYILDSADPALRAYLVERMRTVGPPQRWGVWGAGSALQPGVKDGWSIEENPDGVPHWITATTGFAGAGERYVVAAMFDQVPGGDSVETGVHVLTDLVATVFGAPVPAPAVIPEDY